MPHEDDDGGVFGFGILGSGPSQMSTEDLKFIRDRAETIDNALADILSTINDEDLVFSVTSLERTAVRGTTLEDISEGIRVSILDCRANLSDAKRFTRDLKQEAEQRLRRRGEA